MPKLPSIFWLVAVFFLGTAGVSPLAIAADNISSNYFMRVWQVENGLPQNKVTSLVQARDGYIWAGTYSGLARFDGIRFRVFDEKNTPEMHDRRVTSLFEARDGTLWIGHENGDVTTCKDGKFEAVTIHADWVKRKISAIMSDEADDMWLINASGLLARVRDGRVLSPQRGTATRLLSHARDSTGTIWVALDGRLSVLEHGDLRTLQPDWPLTNSTYIQGIGASHDGGMWVANNGRIRKWQGGKWTQDLGAAPWAQVPLSRLFETRDGTLVATTANTGIFLLFPGTDKPPEHINNFNGYEVDWFLSVMDDREGNLWIGSGGAGLVEIHHSNIQIVEPPDHWRGHALLAAFAASNGDVWIGTEGAGLYHLQKGNWTNFGFTNFTGNAFVWSIAENSAGQLFAATWGSGLFLCEDEHFKRLPGLEQLMTPMPALLAARGGGLWIGTEAGLLRYQDGMTNWFTEADGRSLRDVRTIAEAADGTVWFGTAGNGLASLQKNRLHRFDLADGLPSASIECLHFDDDGALWIGTFGGGLCRLKDGKFFTIDRKEGLPNSVIGDIEDDGSGFFWMSSHGGIIRASKGELNACADGKTSEVRFLTYGINDGLPTIECSEGLQPAGCKTSDGRIWFPTTKGLVVVNPHEVKINHLPPPMALEDFLVDGEPVGRGTSPLRIAPGREHFEFHFTALSFVAPEKVSFKYRIAELESKWVEAGSKRVANYSFLPPGSYTFQVTACNNDGVWNETGVSLSFILLPHFWQTWWFYGLVGWLVVAVASGSVWLDARRRMHRKLEQIERERVLERERARIAHDIHDDLGSQLTRITMLSESARASLDNPKQTTGDLSQIYDTAREATKAMDEIVWAVNPKHDTLESLASYLEKFALDFLNVAGIRCRLNLPLQSPEWPMTSDARHNLFLAYKEALNNVVKHSGATEVQIRLALEKNAFELEVADNGHGFDLQSHQNFPSHEAGRLTAGTGLAGMLHRLRELGGDCKIVSTPGKGTQVIFQMGQHTPPAP